MYMEQDNTTLTISLPKTLKAKAETRSVHGEFGNTSDYVRWLIRNDLEQQRKLAELRRMMQEAEDEVARGEFAVFDEELLDKIEAQGRATLLGSK
jgi:Arc/MetJ-type ribon-helix-helix transcriptional regulator